MGTAYDAGVNFFDNAEVYAGGESERIMGAALKALKWRRDSYLVSSKVFWGGEKPTQKGLSRKHVFDACHAALARLNVDYLDLYFCHRPDPETPVEETVRAMDDLVRQGKVLYWGTSEWSAKQIAEACEIADRRNLAFPTMEQPQYNLYERHKVEVEFAPLYEKPGLGTTIWSPLASGLLTGKYENGIPDGSRLSLKGYEWLRARLETEEGRKRLDQSVRFARLAREHDFKASQLAIAWCLKNPRVSTVILGASRLEQLKENLGALDAYRRLDAELVRRVEEIFAK